MQHALTQGLTLSGAIRAVQAIAWPWVMVVDYKFERLPCDASNFEVAHERMIVVQACTLAEFPSADDLMPVGATQISVEAWPATQFDTMALDVRDRHMAHYRAYLMWRKAVAAEKGVDDLRDGIDYSSRLIDETVQRWVSYGYAEVDA